MVNRYINQIYGGSPPSMDYYRQLGAQKRANEEARKAAEKAAREAEKAREKAIKDAEKAAEKKAEEEALNNLISELASTNKATSPSSSPKKEDKDKGRGFFESLGGLFGVYGDNAQNRTKTVLEALNPFDDVSLKDAAARSVIREGKSRNENKQDWENAENLGQSTLSGMTFGALGDKEKQKGGAYGVTGQLLGSLVPGAGIASGLRMAGMGARLAPGMSGAARAGQRAKEGVLAGGLYGAAEAGVTEVRDPNERTLGQHLGNIGMEAAFGGIADPALGQLFDSLGGLRRSVTRGTPQAEPEELLGLPAPAEQLPAPRQPYNYEAVRNPASALQQPLANTATGRMDTLNDILNIRNNRSQIQNANELLDNRAREFDAETSTQIQDARSKQAELEQSYREMEEEFVKRGRQPYDNTEEIAKATQDWQNVKDMRKQWAEIRKNMQKFRVPKQYKEEYEKLFPRNLLDNSESNRFDVFNAAESMGFEGTHEGALEFGNYLRRLQQANTTKKGDLVPQSLASEADLRQIDNINRQTFPETEDAQGLRQVIDAYDKEIQNLRGRNFQSTEEYQSTQNIIQALEDELAQLQRNVNPQSNVLADLGLLQQGNNARFGEPIYRDGSGGTANIPTQNTSSPETPTDVDIFGLNETPGSNQNSNMRGVDRFTQRISDDLQGIKRTEDLIYGKAEKADMRMYESSRVARGAGGAGAQYTKEVLEPAVKEIQRKGKLNDAFKYVYEKHLLRVKELHPDYNPPRGANEAQLRQTVDQFRNDPDIQQFAETVKTYQRGILDLLEDAEVISAKTKKQLIEDYPDYVPLFRDMEKQDLDGVFEQFGALNRGNVRKAIMELSDHGSEKALKDPIDNLVQYGLNAHHAAFSNRAMRKLADLNDIKIDGKLVAKKIDPKTEAKYNKENIVSFFEKGEPVKYYVNDDIRSSLDALKGITQFDEVANFFHAVAKLQRQSITANPLFAIRQLARDIPQTWTVGNYSLARDLIPAFLDMATGGKFLGNKSLVNEFYKHGAGMANMVSFDRKQFNALQKASNRMKQRGVITATKEEAGGAFRSILDGFRAFNESLENAPRMAQFRATARKTGNLDRAAYDARNLTDFARSGTWTRKVNRYAAFLNATIQGRAAQYQAFKNKPVTTSIKTAVAGALPSYLAYHAYENMASDKQKAIINESPEWQRQTYWLLPHENGEDVIRVPKPYEVAVLASTPLETYLYRDDKVGTDIKDMMKEWANQAILLSFDLNPLMPVAEQILGRDAFTGQDIVPTREQGLPAGEQRDVYSNPIATGISDLAGGKISPRRIEHLLDGYFPMVGATTGDMAAGAMESLGMRENAAPQGSRDVPLLDDFRIRGDNYLANELVGDIHDSTTKVQNMKSNMQNDGELFPYGNAYQAMRKAMTNDSEFAQMIRSIDNDPNLTSEEKAVRRQALLEERNTNARNATRLGLTNPDETNLGELETRYQGLDASPTKDDQFTVILSNLVQAGIPEVDAQRVIDEARSRKLSNVEIARVIRNLLQSYQ